MIRKAHQKSNFGGLFYVANNKANYISSYIKKNIFEIYTYGGIIYVI